MVKNVGLHSACEELFLKTENLQQTSPDSYEIENNDTTWSYRTLFN